MRIVSRSNSTIRRRLLAAVAASGVAMPLAVVFAVPAAAAPPTPTVATSAGLADPGFDAESTSWSRFDLGDRQAVAANADTGGLVYETGAAGLIWDSAIGDTEVLPGFGTGWSWGVASVQKHESADDSVYVPRRGIFRVDAAAPTGLAGYPFDDVLYAVGGSTTGADGSRESFASSLHYPRLGVIVLFDEAGNPVTTVSAEHGRIDRAFTSAFDGGEPRYLSVLTEPGAEPTTIDYRGAGDGTPLVTRPDGSVTVLLRAWTGIVGLLDHTADLEHRVRSTLYRSNGAGSPIGHIRTESGSDDAPTQDDTWFEWDDEGGVTRIELNGKVVFARGVS